MAVSLVKLPPAKPDETQLLRDAAIALRRQDMARKALKDAEDDLRKLCRQYDLIAGVWGFQPHHLRNACQARGIL